jgi:hypothetical protein
MIFTLATIQKLTSYFSDELKDPLDGIVQLVSGLLNRQPNRVSIVDHTSFYARKITAVLFMVLADRRRQEVRKKV